MVTRRDFLLMFLASSVAPTPFAIAAVSNVRRIGFLVGGSPESTTVLIAIREFRGSMKTLGYSQGKDYVLNLRGASGQYERYTEIVNDFVRSGATVIVTTGGTTAVRASLAVTTSVPIVMASGSDP